MSWLENAKCLLIESDSCYIIVAVRYGGDNLGKLEMRPVAEESLLKSREVI
jgi:hypothetical protein